MVSTVRDDVYALYHHRAVWREVVDELIRVDPTETVFADHYTQLYVDRQAIALRRLVDQDPDSLSLTRLLIELAEHPESMTRARHVDLYLASAHYESDDPTDSWLLNEANATFSKYADGDGDNLNPSLVRADLQRWRATCGAIKKVVDKTIAHRASLPHGTAPTATFKELDAAIDTVGEFIKKYTLLFEASSIMKIEPVIQSDWRRPLRAGLFPRQPHSGPTN